jgi:hypothetical protein
LSDVAGDRKNPSRRITEIERNKKTHRRGLLELHWFWLDVSVSLLVRRRFGLRALDFEIRGILFSDDDRRAFGSGIKEVRRHSFG